MAVSHSTLRREGKRDSVRTVERARHTLTRTPCGQTRAMSNLKVLFGQGFREKEKEKQEKAFGAQPILAKRSPSLVPVKTRPQLDRRVWAPTSALAEVGQANARASDAEQTQCSPTRFLGDSALCAKTPAHPLWGRNSHNFERDLVLRRKHQQLPKGVHSVHLISYALWGKCVRPTPHARVHTGEHGALALG